MENKKESDLAVVFEGTTWETELIKGLLESNDIPCITKNNIMTIYSPYTDYEVRLLVSSENEQKAKELIANNHQAE